MSYTHSRRASGKRVVWMYLPSKGLSFSAAFRPCFLRTPVSAPVSPHTTSCTSTPAWLSRLCGPASPQLHVRPTPPARFNAEPLLPSSVWSSRPPRPRSRRPARPPLSGLMALVDRLFAQPASGTSASTTPHGTLLSARPSSLLSARRCTDVHVSASALPSLALPARLEGAQNTILVCRLLRRDVPRTSSQR